MKNHKDILNNTTENAHDASKINPAAPPPETTLKDVVSFVEDFFNKSTIDIKTNYKNGQVPLIREQFDMSHFYKSINTMIEASYSECIDETVQDNSDREQVKILLRSIFNSIQSSNDILATMDCTKKISHLIIVKILSYCLSSFHHYHMSYDRRKQIQEQTNNS